MSIALVLEQKSNDVCKYAKFNLLKVKLVKYSFRKYYILKKYLISYHSATIKTICIHLNEFRLVSVNMFIKKIMMKF